MPTPTKGPRLGGSPQHQRLMLANLATALFEHGRITTTHAKAKRLRPLAEKLITFGKRGDVHARRQVLSVLGTQSRHQKDVVKTLFDDIGPRYAERAGGYTRITKIGPRKGDNAPMAVIELVEDVPAAKAVVSEGERARGTRFAPRRRRGGTEAAVAPATVASAADSGDETLDEGAAAEADLEATETGDEVTATGADAATTDEVTDSAADEPGSADAADDAAGADADGADGAANGEEFDESGAGNQAESAGKTSQAEGDDDKP